MRLKRGVVVLHRGPGVTQVGLARPVVLRGLTEQDQRALAMLEGGRLAPSTLSPTARDGISLIASAGHAAPAKPRAAIPAPTVAIFGAGSIGVAAARSLARHAHAVEFVDTSPAVAESPGVFASPRPSDTCSMAAARDLLAFVPGATVRVGASAPLAAIVIGVGAADPVAWVPLMRADVPHVLVATDEAGIDVGPLVVPGSTACALCVDRAKTIADEAWPMLRLQCGSARRPVVEPQAAEAAGALAAAMLLAWEGSRASQAARRDGATWAVNAIWRVEAGRPPVARPAWPQPECGCGAAGVLATSAMSSAP